MTVKLPCWLIAFLLASLSAFAATPAGKVVLIAGPYSHPPGQHEYDSGCYLLSKFLKQNGVDSTVVTGGWPEDESVFTGARAVVLFMDGGVKHPLLKADRLATLAKLMRAGVGLAALHYAVEIPKERGGAEFLEWLGGYYERPYSTNPFNDADLELAAPPPSHVAGKARKHCMGESVRTAQRQKMCLCHAYPAAMSATRSPGYQWRGRVADAELAFRQ